ncbi:MAG: hypothetical protein SVS85_00030, partial [Candidatus Nanohaloarchaea archaeon]|nr:hypothetical protein [Candidatus Nanohaloarchaea archaeon]
LGQGEEVFPETPAEPFDVETKPGESVETRTRPLEPEQGETPGDIRGEAEETGFTEQEQEIIREKRGREDVTILEKESGEVGLKAEETATGPMLLSTAVPVPVPKIEPEPEGEAEPTPPAPPRPESELLDTSEVDVETVVGGGSGQELEPEQELGLDTEPESEVETEPGIDLQPAFELEQLPGQGQELGQGQEQEPGQQQEPQPPETEPPETEPPETEPPVFEPGLEFGFEPEPGQETEPGREWSRPRMDFDLSGDESQKGGEAGNFMVARRETDYSPNIAGLFSGKTLEEEPSGSRVYTGWTARPPVVEGEEEESNSKQLEREDFVGV